MWQSLSNRKDPCNNTWVYFTSISGCYMVFFENTQWLHFFRKKNSDFSLYCYSTLSNSKHFPRFPSQPHWHAKRYTSKAWNLLIRHWMAPFHKALAHLSRSTRSSKTQRHVIPLWPKRWQLRVGNTRLWASRRGWWDTCLFGCVVAAWLAWILSWWSFLLSCNRLYFSIFGSRCKPLNRIPPHQASLQLLQGQAASL